MVSKGRHQKKEIADALSRLDSRVFTVEPIHRGHRWGRIVCRGCGEDFAIWSTPSRPHDDARRIDTFAVAHATHAPEEDGEK